MRKIAAVGYLGLRILKYAQQGKTLAKRVVQPHVAYNLTPEDLKLIE